MRQEPEAKLREALRALADSTSAAQAPLSLEAALRNEYRRAHPRPARKRVLVWTWTAAAAAALVLAVAVRWRPADTSVRPVAVMPRLAAEAPYATAPLPTELEPLRARPVSAVQLPAEPDLEPLSPWYYNTALPEARLGHIVRVEVSRQAARQFGLALPAGGPEMVKADVWIGDDGITRAIRFVR